MASAAGGIPEGLGETGQLLPDPNVDPEGTAQELAKTLQIWVGDADLRQEIGQASRQRAEQLFKEDRMIWETLLVIEQALQAPVPNEFAQQPEIQAKIDQLTRRLNYAACVWNSWAAHQQGNSPEMKRFLHEALQVSPFEFTTEAVVDWVNDFVRLSEKHSEQSRELSAQLAPRLPAWQSLVEITSEMISSV
ncbi:MAG: hypothetical protein ACFBSC_17975 [Microcoleaceae cyanobacterium]